MVRRRAPPPARALWAADLTHPLSSAITFSRRHRVILDEAHNIKDRASNTAKAAFALKAKFRWCLSGASFSLPREYAVAHHLCSQARRSRTASASCTRSSASSVPIRSPTTSVRSESCVSSPPCQALTLTSGPRCDCKSLHWLCNKGACTECRHSGMQHVCYWNNDVLKPIQYGGANSGEGERAFKKLTTLLERMMLRRTKVERADDLGLPPRVVNVRRDYFTEEEEEVRAILRNGAGEAR